MRGSRGGAKGTTKRGQTTGDAAGYAANSGGITFPSERRRPCTLRFVGVGATFGRRPIFRTSASRTWPSCQLRLCRFGIRASGLVANAHPDPRSVLLRFRARLLRGARVRSRPRVVPRGARPCLGRSHAPRQIQADNWACLPSLRSEDRLAVRRPSASFGAVPTGHLPPVQRRGRLPNRGWVERGENVEPGETEARGLQWRRHLSGCPPRRGSSTTTTSGL